MYLFHKGTKRNNILNLKQKNDNQLPYFLNYHKNNDESKNNNRKENDKNIFFHKNKRNISFHKNLFLPNEADIIFLKDKNINNRKKIRINNSHEINIKNKYNYNN